MNLTWRRSQGLWLKDFTFLIILLWVLTWESLDQLKLLGLGQITLDAVVLWSHLGEGREIAKSKEQKSKNWEGKDFSQHSHVPSKAGAWHFNSVQRLTDACSPRSVAAHWSSHVAAGATSIPHGKKHLFPCSAPHHLPISYIPVAPAHVFSSSFRTLAYSSRMPTGTQAPARPILPTGLITFGGTLLMRLLFALGWLSATHRVLFWGHKDK